MNQLPEFIEDLLKNNYKINQRMIIKGSIKSKKFIAFNDIVISRKNLSSMLEVKAKIDGKAFNTYFGDGLIVSTPSGSTAYNLSVGGPIVYPLTWSFYHNFYSSASLTQRPISCTSWFEIEFKVTQDSGAVVIIDGQELYDLEKDEIIKIKIATKKAKMLHRSSRGFF